MSLDLNTLLQDLQRGDPPAIARVYQEYGDRLLQVARQHTGDSDAAHDIVQDFFVKMCLMKLSSIFATCTDLEGFLKQGIRWKCGEYWKNESRRRKRIVPLDSHQNSQSGETSTRIEPADPCPRAEEIVERNDDVARLKERVHRLPEDEREVIELRLKGLSQPEVAAQLNLTVRTVYNREFRAKQRLRNDDQLQQGT